MTDLELMGIARMARKKSYSPYSKFAVGAALQCSNDDVYVGCNIENASYGATICAERVAITKAVSQGRRDFLAIAIAGGPAEAKAGELTICPPCGVCRQVMREFGNPDSFRIILEDGKGGTVSYLLKELLPLDFGPENL